MTFCQNLLRDPQPGLQFTIVGISRNGHTQFIQLALSGCGFDDSRTSKYNDRVLNAVLLKHAVCFEVVELQPHAASVVTTKEIDIFAVGGVTGLGLMLALVLSRRRRRRVR